ncbi:MAG: hypothetical protein K9M54_00375 [Kiritimatiellales bacterium]|nr:hypothetical protein [Kiritimatiellales bacterium]
MKPLMYKQRPAFPALVGAGASLLAGLFCFAMIYRRVESGEIGSEKLTALILVSIATSGIFLIAAFARYQFIHLWKKPSRHPSGRRK